MSHWIIAPILLPAFTAVGLLLSARLDAGVRRAASLVSALALLAVSVALVARAATGEIGVYAIGDWPPPFGIVLVLDRLSAGMTLLTAVVAVAALLHAMQGWDARGRNFHALFHFQLMGLNGAFLTGDLFNLFVFFEVLLIASYGLLLHGGGADRMRAGVHYVVFNLVASALFLFAVGILYGTLGTLNLADLSLRVAAAGETEAALVRAGALLLLVVFAAKAAALPLYFWLPAAYGAAPAPVAALFSILTKVGVYAIARVFTLVFGPGAGVAADVALPWLLPAGLLTLAAATAGVLAASTLRALVAYLVVASIGVLLAAIGLFRPASLAAALYYLAHSTVVVAGLFLLAELIAGQRQDAGDRLERGPELVQPGLLGGLFLVAAMAVAGMPPLSGFVGKLLVLESAVGAPPAGWLFAVVLGSGLLTILALARAGSTLFWSAAPARGAGARPAPLAAFAPAMLLLAAAALLVVLAGPATGYAEAAAAQLTAPGAYVEAVLSTRGR